MKEISVEKAANMVLSRKDSKTTLILPYKIGMKNDDKKVKRIDSFSLKFLFNAIRLTNLKHPETEDLPMSVDIKSIVSCYIFGSAVHPKYEKITKKYLFGLYVREQEVRILPDDIDIMCFVNNGYDKRHIKSMTSWEITISGHYGDYNENRYGFFDVSHVPSSLVYDRYEENKDFLKHIRDCGVCIMGKNIVRAKRYASWEHDTIKDTINCVLPREENVTGEMIKKQIEENTKHERFEILDL